MTTHCRQLRYKYDPDTAQATFEDGTVYTAAEMVYLAKSNLTKTDENAVHAVKRIFSGEILMPKIDSSYVSASTRAQNRAGLVRPDQHIR